jgi:hypothetical protein
MAVVARLGRAQFVARTGAKRKCGRTVPDFRCAPIRATVIAFCSLRTNRARRQAADRFVMCALSRRATRCAALRHHSGSVHGNESSEPSGGRSIPYARVKMRGLSRGEARCAIVRHRSGSVHGERIERGGDRRSIRYALVKSLQNATCRFHRTSCPHRSPHLSPQAGRGSSGVYREASAS